MKYKNVTKNVLKFRAHDKKMVKKVFELKPNETLEFGKEVDHNGLELVEENKKNKESD